MVLNLLWTVSRLSGVIRSNFEIFSSLSCFCNARKNLAQISCLNCETNFILERLRHNLNIHCFYYKSTNTLKNHLSTLPVSLGANSTYEILVFRSCFSFLLNLWFSGFDSFILFVSTHVPFWHSWKKVLLYKGTHKDACTAFLMLRVLLMLYCGRVVNSQVRLFEYLHNWKKNWLQEDCRTQLQTKLQLLPHVIDPEIQVIDCFQLYSILSHTTISISLVGTPILYWVVLGTRFSISDSSQGNWGYHLQGEYSRAGVRTRRLSIPMPSTNFGSAG